MSGKGQTKGKAKGAVAKGKRKRSNALSIMRVPAGKVGFPQGMRTKLRMVHTQTFEPSGVIVSAEPIQANGLFQPIASAPSKKPRGFDQFMAIYGDYTVLGCKATVRYMYEGYHGPATTTAGTDELLQTVIVPSGQADALACVPVACGLRKGTSVLGTVSSDDVIERERVNTRFITSQEGSKTINISVGTGEFYKNYTTVSAEGYTGSASSNPVIPVFIEPWVARPVIGYDDSDTRVLAVIELEFDTVFTNPHPLQVPGSSGL